MTEDQIDRAEILLAYYDIHLADNAPHPAGSPHREWNNGDMAELLRDMLPEWSAFKSEDVSA
jgi:hypothetical protein